MLPTAKQRSVASANDGTVGPQVTRCHGPFLLYVLNKSSESSRYALIGLQKTIVAEKSFLNKLLYLRTFRNADLRARPLAYRLRHFRPAHLCYRHRAVLLQMQQVPHDQ